MTPTTTQGVTLDLYEQIAFVERAVKSSGKHPTGGSLCRRYTAILASLKRLAAIDAVKVPEPVKIEYMHRFINCVPFGADCPPEDIARAHAIFTEVIDPLQRETARADEYRDNGQRLLEAADGWKLRAEAKLEGK